MKCSKCHRDATKKIQLKEGFLPCCDSYDCNLLLRFELIKPQINNAMKSLIIILALLTINCNVANTIDAPVNKNGIITDIGYDKFKNQTDIVYEGLVYNGETFIITPNNECDVLAITSEGHGNNSVLVSGNWKECLDIGNEVYFSN
jgi:hypothetical protein